MLNEPLLGSHGFILRLPVFNFSNPIIYLNGKCLCLFTSVSKSKKASGASWRRYIVGGDLESVNASKIQKFE